MITVLVVEDNERVRAALVELLSSVDDIEVAGECSDGDEVVEAYGRLRPDVVLMDVAMARMDGLEATQLLLADHPDARVVVLTGTVSSTLVRRAEEAGAVGYQVKGDDPAALVDAIRRVAHGGTGWSPRALAYHQPDGGNGNGRHNGALAP